MPRVLDALLAGLPAIALNTGALAAADLVPLGTAHGGLLHLLVMLTGGAVPSGAAFRIGFHVVVGLAMAVFYAFALEPVLPGPAWLRGLLFALAVWVANAVVVLPMAGEGLAGARNVSLAGIVWFAVAHTLFFVLLAVLYAWLRQHWLRPPAPIEATPPGV
jgi:hypothetical protein